MPAAYDYATSTGYVRSRADWLDFPSTSTPITQAQMDQFDQALKDIKDTVINVKDFQAVGNGSTDDSTKIQAACDALPSTGGVLYFPAGTYLTDEFTITSKNEITIMGPGIIKRKPTGSPDTGRVCTFTTCVGIQVFGMRFDMNNIERFGGINLITCTGVWFDQCYFYDSNLNASFSTFDHYSIVATTNCSDFWITNCYAEDVELAEIDNSERVFILNNVSRRAAGTCAIGWFSVSSSEKCIDYTIAGNTIIDPRRGGIFISHESGGLNTNTIRNLRIMNNTVSRLTTAICPTTVYLIAVGNLTGSASTGNSYKNIRIEGNELYVDPALTAHTVPLLFVMQQTGNTFARTTVRGNRATANAATDWNMDLRRLSDSRVDDNEAWDGTLGISVDSNSTTTSYRNNFSNASTTKYSCPLPTLASAATLTIPNGAEVVSVTGTTTVTSVTAGFVGQRVTLVFTGILTFTDGSNLKLAGNFVTTADDAISLVYDGTNWNETSRSVN